MPQSIGITIIVIWFAIIVWFLISLCLNYCRKRVVTKVLQKGIKEEGLGSQREYFRYLCEPVFSCPSEEFDLKESVVTIELIHINQRKEKIKLQTIEVNFKTGAEKTRDLCCSQDIRAFFEIIRLKVLPPITRVRAIHNCSKDSLIFLDGIEINDQKSGDRLFFTVNAYIHRSDIKAAIVHNIKPQELLFCTKQTFFPDFLTTNVETFGTKIPNPVNSYEDINGVKLLPKLNSFEVLVFNTFLIHLSFTLMIALFDNFQDQRKNSIWITVCTGMTTPSVTQLIAYVYRVVIKSNYNSSCSPMKLESNEWSMFWQFFRSFYLTLFLSISLLLSIFDVLFISQDFKLQIQMNGFSEEMVLLLYLFLCLTIAYTLWLSVFALIRYSYRFLVFKQSNPESEELGEKREQTNTNTVPTVPPEASEKEKTTRSAKPDKELAKPPKKVDQNNKSLNNKKSTTEDDSYATERSKSDDLNTGSVIVRPTQSLGYIDPEIFRLSESRIDSQNDNNFDKK